MFITLFIQKLRRGLSLPQKDSAIPLQGGGSASFIACSGSVPGWRLHRPRNAARNTRVVNGIEVPSDGFHDAGHAGHYGGEAMSDHRPGRRTDF